MYLSFTSMFVSPLKEPYLYPPERAKTADPVFIDLKQDTFGLKGNIIGAQKPKKNKKAWRWTA